MHCGIQLNMHVIQVSCTNMYTAGSMHIMLYESRGGFNVYVVYVNAPFL